MPDALLDTNVLARLVLNDVPEQREQAAAAISDAARNGDRLFVAAITISELVFVVRGAVYGLDRSAIADVVQSVLDLPITVLDRAEVELALDLYRDVHPDWDDCLLAAYARTRAGGRVLSFDRGLARMPGLSLTAP